MMHKCCYSLRLYEVRKQTKEIIISLFYHFISCSFRAISEHFELYWYFFPSREDLFYFPTVFCSLIIFSNFWTENSWIWLFSRHERSLILCGYSFSYFNNQKRSSLIPSLIFPQMYNESNEHLRLTFRKKIYPSYKFYFYDRFLVIFYLRQFVNYDYVSNNLLITSFFFFCMYVMLIPSRSWLLFSTLKVLILIELSDSDLPFFVIFCLF